jgi:uncharacterized protein
MDLRPYIGIAQDAFAIALIVAFPLIDFPAMQRLKRFSSSLARLAVYRRGILSTWIVTGLAVWLAWPASLLIIPRSPGSLAWLEGRPTAQATAAMVIALLFTWILWPSIKCSLNQGLRKKYLKAYAASFIRFMLPVSRQERAWWVSLSVTAGICEELLCRGFMLRYLSGHLVGGPALSLTVAWLLSSLAFGAAHLYQGWQGVIETTAAGLVFGMLALLCGNLALPMLLHALVDLRILLIYNPAKDDPESAAVLINGFHPKAR